MNIRKDYAKYFDIIFDIKKTFLGKDAPDELKEFIRQVHLKHFYESLPNEWIYSKISEAFYEVGSKDFTPDNIEVIPDIYRTNLYKWLGEPYADKYCNECITTMDDINTIWSLIACAQGLARGRIYREVIDYIKDGELN
jgi:hypothetical protein